MTYRFLFWLEQNLLPILGHCWHTINVEKKMSWLENGGGGGGGGGAGPFVHGENLIILVIYFMYPVNPFIDRSGISQLREFPWDRAEFSDYARLQNWKWILQPNVPNRLFYSK